MYRKRQSNTPGLCFGSDASEVTADGSKAFVGCAMASESGWISQAFLPNFASRFSDFTVLLDERTDFVPEFSGGVGLVRLNLSL